jgi:beta-lactamase regulating signal transducer with metallopeptidase domain
MILASILHAFSVLLPHLIAPAVRSLLIASLAALALAALRVRSVAARLAVWTAVLYAALAMPLLGIVLPSISLDVPSAAARFVSQRLGPVLVPRANENSAEMQAADPAPVVILRDPLPATRDSHIRAKRERVPSYVASVIPDSDPVAVFSPVIAPLPSVEVKRQPIPWIAILAAIYFFVAILFLARLLLGVVFSRRLVRSARPILDGDATRPLALRACEEGLVAPPQLAESESISVPVTLGILRPVILFPVEWREWDAAALHAVIAHELSHVIRRDALTQRLSLLHRAIFWFSPLGWWLHRRLADAAEEASDEAALVSGADRERYAETLLGFFATLQETPQRVYWEGVSMAKAGQAEKRVDRILAWKGEVSMRVNKFLAISILLVGVPVVLFAATARPSVADTSVVKASVAITNDAQGQTANPAPVLAPAMPAPPANASPSAPPVPAAPAVSSPVVAPALPLPAPQPMPVVAPKPAPAAPKPMALAAPKPAPKAMAAPAPPPVPASVRVVLPKIAIPPIDVHVGNVDVQSKDMQQIYDAVNDKLSRIDLSKDFDEVQKTVELQLKQFEKDSKFQMQFANDGRPMKLRTGDGGYSDRYVVVSGDAPISMSGDSQDVEHATALRAKISGDFIWFQRDEKSYIIRDQATVNRAKEIFKPEQELGQKQQALGKQQQALGDQQRDLGKKLQTIQVQLPDMTADMQKLEAEMKQLTAGGTQQQLGDLQRQIGELQRKVGQVESQAGDQQRQAAEPMRALGQQQRELGDQQRALGEQQREASRQARDQMKQLLDDAIAHGTAQPE